MNIWIEAVVRGIKKQGIQRTARGVMSTLADCWFDIRYGTDTLGWTRLDDLDIGGENKHRGANYKASKAEACEAYVGRARLSTGGVFS
jgi:hypothetical protein